MPRPKKPGLDRFELRAGPLGPYFVDAISDAARAVGETFSDYIRRAVKDRMEREGRPFDPTAVPKKGRK